MKQRKQHGLMVDVVLGLVAGAAATYVMDKVSTYGYRLEDLGVRKFEENLRGGEYPPEVLAAGIAKEVYLG
jgi:hypothetical protein